MSQVVAVTGATGFVGSHLVHRLVEQGSKVRVLVRSCEKAKEKLPASIEVFQGDITDKEAVNAFVQGSDVLFHLASILQEPSTPDKVFWEVHVEATRHLLEAAIQHQLKRFIHFSTIGVLGSPKVLPANEQSPYQTKDIYQTTKCEAEKLALKTFRETGLSGAVIRPAAVYGPGDLRMLKLFKFIANGKFRMIGKGNIYNHPVHVDDLVSGALLAAEKKEHQAQVYIIGGEKPVLLKDWVKLISKVTDRPITKHSVPFLPVYFAAALCELICKPLKINPPLYRRRVEFFSKSRAFDISKAKKELNYQPKINLDEGVQQTYQWYKENSYL